MPFIGHIASGDGLLADLAKVQAISEMPSPTDRTGVQRLGAMVQYLRKFVPLLLEIKNPLLGLFH